MLADAWGYYCHLLGDAQIGVGLGMLLLFMFPVEG